MARSRGTRGRSLKLRKPLEPNEELAAALDRVPPPRPPPGTIRIDHYPEDGGPRTTQFLVPPRGLVAPEFRVGQHVLSWGHHIQDKRESRMCIIGGPHKNPSGEVSWDVDGPGGYRFESELCAVDDASADELAGGLEVVPRPSCCVECGQSLVGYSTCGKASCVFELIYRQRRGSPG